MRRLIPLAFALVFLAGAQTSHGAGPQMAFGAAEDVVRQPDPAVARQKMAQLAAVGMRAVRVTSFWVSPATAPDGGEITILRNVTDAARRYGVSVYVTVMSPGSKTTPLTPEAQAQFAQYAAGVVRAVPAIRSVIVGNEPNLNRFWLPQFNPDGSDAAAPAYVSLLAQSYDAIKAVDPTITVYGGALAPRGIDRPNTGRDTHSPTAFITDMGTAYRASGRTTPLMDAFTFHPYGEASNTRPDLAHPNSTAIGLADYGKLVTLLGRAFDGTAQAGSTLPILYDEYGVESVIPELKASSYTGAEPTTTHPVDETTQAAYYTQALTMAFCQPNVVGVLLFHSQDENARASWQSGVYYADGSQKASFFAVKSALDRSRGGSITHCDGMLLDVAPTQLRIPKAAALPGGKAVIQLVCPLDCTATVQLIRSDGKKIWGRRVYSLAEATTRINVGKLKLRPGRYAFTTTVVHPVNPGTPSVTQGGTFIVR